MTDQPSPKLISLLHGLLTKTKQKQLPWSEVLDSFDTRRGFDLTLTRSTVEIETRDGDDTYPYTLRVRGERGEEIDSMTVLRSDDDYYNLGELYQTIARQVGNVDEKLDEVLRELGIRDAPF